MSEGAERGGPTDRAFASLLTALATGVVLFLVPPTTAAMGTVSRANLYIAVPFAFIAITLLPLVLESFAASEGEDAPTAGTSEAEADLERDAGSGAR